MNKKYIKNLIISFIVGICMLLFGLVRIKTDEDIQVRILYKYFTEVKDDCVMTVCGGGEDYELLPHLPIDDTKKGGWLDAIYTLSDSMGDIDDISIELLRQDEGYSCITSIEIYNHHMPVVKYKAEDLPLFFETTADRVVLDDVGINYYTDNGSSMYINATDRFLADVNASKNRNKEAYINCVILSMVIACIICIVLNAFTRYINTANLLPQGTWDYLLLVILITVFVLSLIIAFSSKHHSHCDEDVTRHAIDYYLRAWNAPDYSSNWIAGTASYEFSNCYRAMEDTLYYLFAGKVAWIASEYFHINMYYRTLGICLMLTVLIICWVSRKEHGYLLAAVLLSPQIWYLFSYATSDHWDYFWAFIIVSLTCPSNGLLHKSTDPEISIKKRVVYILMCSLLFTQLFIGKSNYLVILLIPFIEYLSILIRSSNKLRLIVIYISILVITLGMTFIIQHRYREPGIDLSIDKSESTEIEIDDTVWQIDEIWSSPKEQGVSFNDFLWHIAYQPTPVILYISALGSYYWSSVNPNTGYYYAITFMYIILCGMFVYQLKKQQNVEQILKALGGLVACIMIFSAAIWYCYVQTYQPQGRYLLPIFIILIYVFSQAGRFSKTIQYKVILTTISTMGIISYLITAIIKATTVGFII